ncbi:MAG: hypothetical protein GF418_03910 [Chitinivibrionales bacterium]|nr:hypothetical protein [Chitinivibrionales bacterium]MBD3394751.1 hypothetical protein [Chitinivibrionales bacterium]
MSRGTKIPRYRYLTDEQCRLLHEGTCGLLEQVGIDVAHQGAARLLLDAGANERAGRVCIPRHMVDAAIAGTAKRIELAAKDPESTVVLDPDNGPLVHFGTGGQALTVLEYVAGAFDKRPARTEDLAAILRLCENLEHVDFITRPVEPDVAEHEMDLVKTRVFMENTTRHMNLANLVRVENLPAILDMVGDRGRVSFISCLLVSPLHMVDETTEKFMRIVEAGVPVAVSSCCQAGTTAPLSETGAIMQVNAEVLSAIVLGNMVRPGAKLLHRGLPITADLYGDGSPRWCQPDSIRRLACMADLTCYYGIPCCGTAGVSDEPVPSAQTIAEKALGITAELAAGAQFVNSALGLLDRIMTVCPEQYVIDNTIISLAKKHLTAGNRYDLVECAESVVRDSLAAFGAPFDDDDAVETAARAAYVVSAREDISSKSIDTQIETIGKAVCTGQSSTAFMRAARKGLRAGLLYNGSRLESAIDLERLHGAYEMHRNQRSDVCAE